MPLPLNENERLVIEEVVTPAVKADQAWISQVIINAPHNGVWSAVLESHPFDGQKVYHRDAGGNDTMIQIRSDDLQADMAKDPSLVHRVETLVGILISIAGDIKALREGEKREQVE